MAAQTEFERGFIAGVQSMRMAAAIRVLEAVVPVPKQEKED